MKRCEVCNKLADNGDRRCQKCGTEFKYDPRVTPFSESRIIFALLVIALVSWVVYNALPLKMPNPSECSRTSYRRFDRIANTYYGDTKRILRSDMLLSADLSELRAYRNKAEAVPVPVCLEPAKEDLISYLNEVYYIGVFSRWGAYRGAAYRTENAGIYWDAVVQHFAEVKDCLPDCP